MCSRTWGGSESSPLSEARRRSPSRSKHSRRSDVRDLEVAIGQYVFYRSLLARFEPERRLYLAVLETVFVSTLQEPIYRPVLEDLSVALIAFDPRLEVIVQWTP